MTVFVFIIIWFEVLRRFVTLNFVAVIGLKRIHARLMRGRYTWLFNARDLGKNCCMEHNECL